MKKAAIVVLMTFGAASAFGQTILIDPNGDGGFESGQTFAANGWTVVNDVVNAWRVGTATMKYGLRGAYISDDVGFTNRYAGTVRQVSHFYRDVTFPANEPEITLEFYHRGGTDGDILRVFLIPTDYTPTAGSDLLPQYHIGDDYHRIRYQPTLVTIPRSNAGTKKRLVFSWRNDDINTNNPPIAIDGIGLFSKGSVTSNGTGGGNVSNTSTWAGGPPGPTDNVTVLDGDTVILDSDFTCQNLFVEGVLEFESVTPRTCEVNGDVTISRGGIFRCPEVGGAITHILECSGNFVNNGKTDFYANATAPRTDLRLVGSRTPTICLFESLGSTDLFGLTIHKSSLIVAVDLIVDNVTVQNQEAGISPWLTLEEGEVHVTGDASIFGSLENMLNGSTLGEVCGLRIGDGRSPMSAYHPGPLTVNGWIDVAVATFDVKGNLIVNGEVDVSGGQLGVGGSMTVNGGALHVKTGEIKVGTSTSHTLALTSGAAFTMDGGKVTVAGAHCVTPPSSQVNWEMNGGEIVVGTAGSISSTVNATFDLGNSSNSKIEWHGGKVVIQNSNVAQRDFRVPTFPIPVIADGAMLQLGNNNTSGPTNWNIEGSIPNISFNGTSAHTVRQSGNAILRSSTTIKAGETFNVNGNVLAAMKDLTVESGGTLNASTGGSIGSQVAFRGTAPQTFTNNGTNKQIPGMEINNTSGATPAVTLTSETNLMSSLNLVNGSLGGSAGSLLLGNAAASPTFMTRRGNGQLLIAPVYGSNVVQNLEYTASTQPIVMGLEFAFNLNGALTINNPAGVIFTESRTVAALSLTSGILTAKDVAAVITVSGSVPSAVSVGPTTSFVDGSIRRIISAASPPGGYAFPVGRSRLNAVTLVNPLTTGDVVIQVDVFDTNSGGTAGTGLSSINTNRHWHLSIVKTPEKFISTKIGLTESLSGGNRIGKSETVSGTYNSISGPPNGNTITSADLSSFSYFVIGTTTSTYSGAFSAGVAGTYPTLTAAVDDVTTGVLTGPVVLTLLDASYPSETFPINVNQITGISATNTLTIKPASGVSPIISGSSATAIFRLNGADYVTIDGSNNGSTSRNMTITNTSSNSSTAVVWLSSGGTASGATNNTIKNCNISAGSNQSTSNAITYGVLSSGSTVTGTSDGADNDSNVFQNNAITKARYGIYLRGASGNPDEGNSIVSNLIGPAAFGQDQIGKAGIIVQHQTGAAIEGNEIRFVGVPAGQSPPGDDRIGVGLGADRWAPLLSETSTITNSTVARNRIHDIVDGRSYSAVGVVVTASGSYPSSNTIANNMIHTVLSNGSFGEQAVGIAIAAGDGDKVVFNSIRMEGDIDPSGAATSTGSAVGIRVGSTSLLAPLNLTLKNNIIHADINSNTSSLNHFGIVVASSSFKWGTGGLDYNIVYVNASNAQMKLGGIGTTIPYAVQADLAAWKTQFSGLQDANSRSFVPNFTSATDLHLNLSSVNANYVAIPIAGVTMDFDGQTRSLTAPYKGADELTGFLLPDLIAPAAPQNAAVVDSGNTAVTLRWRKNAESDFLRYRIYRNTTPGATTKVDSTTGGAADTSKTLGGLVNGVRYYMRITAVDNAGNESAYSNEVNAMPAGNAAPSAPSSLVVTDSSSKTITIKWRTNNEADFLRYRIYRSTAPFPVTKVDSTTAGVTDTSKTFTGLTNGTRYYFRISAVDNAGNESSYSNEVNAVPADRVAPKAPQNLAITDSSSTRIGIKWRRNSDPDFLRYRIYRGTSPGPTTRVDSTTAGAADTSKTFTGLTNGTRYYSRVTAVDSSGNESAYSNEVNGAPNTPSAVDRSNNQIPNEYSLTQNYPNPFNPSTVIRYDLPKPTNVTLKIFNALGQEISTLVSERKEAGYHQITWNATVPSGIYFYRLQAGEYVETKKMILLR